MIHLKITLLVISRKILIQIIFSMGTRIPLHQVNLNFINYIFNYSNELFLISQNQSIRILFVNY